MTTETTQACPPEYGAATGSEFRLPVVAGRRSSASNADFERACLVHIERLQHGIGPYDSAMMATFCEAVRMVREYSDAMQVHSPSCAVALNGRHECSCGAKVSTPDPAPEVRACSSCVSYIAGSCWLHGVGVRGTTLGRECFQARRGGVQQGGKEGKGI